VVRKLLSSQQGDTLIEVLVSMAILAMVIVGSSILVNNGLGQARNAVEHTQVRNSLQQQSEYLRFLRDNQSRDATTTALWQTLTNSTYASLSPVNTSDASCTLTGNTFSANPTGGKKAFYLKFNTTPTVAASTLQIADITSMAIPPTAAVPGSGLWVEGVRSAAGINPAFVDYYIRGCWQGLGSTGVQQMGTVTRLYLP
jgi:prepilin-type N-terminal cleavage/methylation domain-containing protein